MLMAGSVPIAPLGSAPFDRVTARPPDGAGRVRMIVPRACAPPLTWFGLNAIALRSPAAGVTVRFALAVTPSLVADIFTTLLEVTAVVVIGKVAYVLLWGTVTVAGICATPELLLESAIAMPPEGAALFR